MVDLLTPEELAEKMKVSINTVYGWIRQGLEGETKSPPRFIWEDVRDWLNNRSNKK